MVVSDRTRRLRSQSIHYLENALAYLEAKDAEKASEFLWGSMAEALKAVASLKGVTLRSHRQLSEYAKELARELRDKDVFQVFLLAQSLHRNFYELGTELEEVAFVGGEVRRVVAKLLNLVPV